MLTELQLPYTLMTAKDATALAAELNADPDDTLTYLPVHDTKGTGWSYVLVIDENGERIGNL